MEQPKGILKSSIPKDVDEKQKPSTSAGSSAVKHFKIPKKSKDPAVSSHEEQTSKEKSTKDSASANFDDEKSTSSVRHYKIPRKDKDQNKNVLQEIMFNSREYSQDIYPIIKQNYYQRVDSERNFRYIHCYLVQNPELSSKMDARKKEMKNSKIYTDKDLVISYGFLEVLSIAEAEKICKEGLQCGHRTFGCLGQPKLGVYLSRCSDVLTAAPLTSGVSGTFIVFKVIKGRIKLVPYQSGHLEPTPNFDCHIIKSLPNDIAAASSSRLFESLQMYLYEYDDTELVTEIRQICPMAVLTYDYGSPSARSKDHVLWMGTLTCGEKFSVPRVQMLSQFSKMKPYSLGKSLAMKKLTTYAAAVQWQPIVELRTDSMQSNLYRRRELRLNNGMYVSVFRFSQDRSEEFTSFVQKLASNNAVALSSLRGGTFMVMFSLGELSDQIGIPRYCDTFLSLHCLIVSYRSCVAGMDFGKDPYDLPSLPTTVPAGYRVNPVRLELLTLSLQSSANETSNPRDSPQEQQMAVPDVDMEMEKVIPIPTEKIIPAVPVEINIPQLPLTALSNMNIAAAARDPRILRKVGPPPLTVVVPAKTTPQQKRPLLEAPRPIDDMELCSPDSPERQETTASGQISPLSVVRRETGVSASDLAFITIEDTPSSPGPQEAEEKHEVYRPPVIVPLESIKQSFESTVRKPSHPSKVAFVLPEAAKKSLEEVALRSPAVSMSSAEKAIINLTALRIPSTSFASASAAPRPVNERQSTASSSVDESEADRLVIAENPLTTFAPPDPIPPRDEPSTSSVEPLPNVISLGDGIYLDDGPVEEEIVPDPVAKGVLIPDDLIFLKTAAEEAETILQSFQRMKETREIEWSLKVHSQMVLKLADSKKNLDPHSTAHERVTKLLVLLTRYRSMGIVELLSRHECDVKSRAAIDYLPCVIKLKQENPNARCVFLSNLGPDSDGAKEFLNVGISVVNVSTFIEKFLKVKP